MSSNLHIYQKLYNRRPPTTLVEHLCIVYSVEFGYNELVSLDGTIHKNNRHTKQTLLHLQHSSPLLRHALFLKIQFAALKCVFNHSVVLV